MSVTSETRIAVFECLNKEKILKVDILNRWYTVSQTGYKNYQSQNQHCKAANSND